MPIRRTATEGAQPLRAFHLSYEQALSPGAELAARVSGEIDADGTLRVVWESLVPDDGWDAVELEALGPAATVRDLVRALAPLAADGKLVGPSFPSLDECIGDWSADLSWDADGLADAEAEWLLLATADFEGQHLRDAVVNATPDRIHRLAAEHDGLLTPGAVRNFYTVQARIDSARSAKARQARTGARPIPGESGRRSWLDVMAASTGPLPLNDALVECLEDWANSGDPTASSDQLDFLFAQVTGRGAAVVALLQGAQTYGANLALEAMRSVCRSDGGRYGTPQVNAIRAELAAALDALQTPR